MEHLRCDLKKEDKLKYYACGEYGENGTKRPHFHLIVFNGSRSIIEEAWEWGDVHCVQATRETIAYVTKYMDKWRNKKQDWRKPYEFNVQSSRLGS